MQIKKTVIYFVPGLAAGKEIFKNIDLPKDRYEVQILEWLIPEKGESMVSYAKRMAARVTEPDAILVGVSFGGVVAQEMSLFLSLRKLIIISSIKSKDELPARLKLTRKTKLHRLVPTGLILSAQDLTNYAVGPRSRKRLKIYNEYLHVRNKQYLDWAIENMVCWQRKEPLDHVVHIHGDGDVVLPAKNMSNFICIKGGTHVMILNKGRQISDKLVEIIENN